MENIRYYKPTISSDNCIGVLRYDGKNDDKVVELIHNKNYWFTVGYEEKDGVGYNILHIKRPNTFDILVYPGDYIILKDDFSLGLVSYCLTDMIDDYLDENYIRKDDK